SGTLEDIARLLWGVSAEARAGAGPQLALPSELRRGPTVPRRARARMPAAQTKSFPTLAQEYHSGELSRVFLELARHASEDPPSHGRTLAVLQAEAAEILATLAHTLLGPSKGLALHQRLAKAWGCEE